MAGPVWLRAFGGNVEHAVMGDTGHSRSLYTENVPAICGEKPGVYGWTGHKPDPELGRMKTCKMCKRKVKVYTR